MSFVVSTSTVFLDGVFVWADRTAILSGICAFFGHRDTPITDELSEKLEQAVRNLINNGFNEFWVCYEGNFDWLSRMVMQKIKAEYGPAIYICFIRAYNPNKFSKIKLDWLTERYELDYPREVAEGTPKFAIERRNRYIADNADAIICYIIHRQGGAYKAVHHAEKNGKMIINLAN